MNEFLDALYGDLPEGAWFYLWELSPRLEKRTTWFQDTASAAAHAEQSHGVNVYYPIAWAKQPGDGFHRMEISQTAGIVGLVADLDFVTPHKPHAFPGEDEAIDAISRLPLKPSACIHSGHGLQCVWLLKEPWEFDAAHHRQEAQALSMGWGYSIAHIVNRMGYEVDAVHDLTRVMRLPGTSNVKNPNLPVPVVVRWFDDDCRYNPESFEPYLADVPASALKSPLPDVDLSTAFPLDKHEALLQADEDYAATYRHERTMPKDNSCSAFDMSLAARTVRAGWTDNEITALLVANQRKYGNKPEKLSDAKYFARTIAQARRDVINLQAETAASAVLTDVTTDREDKIKALANKWAIPLTDVQVVTGDPSIFRFWIAGKCAQIPATKLVSQQAFLGEMFSTAQKFPKPIGPKDSPKWHELMNILGEVAEVIEAGAEATRDGSLAGLLRDFLEDRGLSDLEEIDERQRGSTPFRSEGFVWFRLSDVLTYAKMNDTEHLGRREFAQRLRAMGGKPQRFHAQTYRNGGKRTTLSFYGLPETALSDPAGLTNADTI